MTSRDISEEIIESLYAEALLLADDARAVFGLKLDANINEASDQQRIALSIEGLRTTTRVMHVLAWLLNQRAFLSGELTESQLRRHNSLPDERLADPANLALLDSGPRELIIETERLHARVARLDHDWRQQRETSNTPVHALHGKITQAFGQRG